LIERACPLNKWVLRENIKFRLFFARLEKTRNLGLLTKKTWI
jgi:hypothetical protein